MTVGQKDIPPGSIHHPKFNYGLHERVIRVDVNEKALKTKQQLLEEKQQAMMLQKWNDSVHLPACKHSHATSDLALSNTLLPSHINPNDLRQARSTLLASPRSSPARASSQSPTGTSGWNSSTAYSSRELEERSRMLLGSSLGATRARATALLNASGKHMSLVEQQTALAEAVRQQKAAAEESKAALVQKYGVEGAAAMQSILAMPCRKETLRAPRRGAPKEDVEAVRQLPDEVPGALPPASSEKGSDDDE